MFNRRDFIRAGAMAGGLSLLASEGAMSEEGLASFKTYQAARRALLWSLLGDLPEKKAPVATLKKVERHQDFTLEHLDLELNGLETVPALLLIPDRRAEKAPGLMYHHWHGGDYFVGKRELLVGTGAMKAYAPVYAQKGIVTLAIDSWCFGERAPYAENGGRGESDTFKEMLWKGRVLFGMMMFDEWQALNYLCARPEVDPSRIGSFGISMGSTKSWWLAALDERITCCMDLCCLTDFDALIEDKGLARHGIYYYVPSLLKHFNTAEINELIVPRSRISLNGRFDGLTPPAGVERVREHLTPLYGAYGSEEDCRIALFDCKHEEIPAIRAEMVAWLDRL